MPFHPGRLALAGTPVPILQDVGSTQTAGGDFALTQNGTFLYLAGKAIQAGWSISWLESSGKSQPLHAPLGAYLTPRFSPDSKRLAYSFKNDIWVKDLDRDILSRLSFLPGENVHPVWTPDGKTIVFQSANPAAPGLYAIRSDGSGGPKRMTQGMPKETPSSFSKDGKRLAISQTGNGGSIDIFTLPVEADSGPGAAGIRLGKAELFLGTSYSEGSPVFSPDGRWLAYVSNESGANEVFVRPFPGPGGRWQVSQGGGMHPRWSRDGRDLFFASLDRHVMAISYTAKGDSFVAGKPRAWTETRLRALGGLSDFDLAHDGKRLAAFVAEDASSEKFPAHLTFLMNFGDELHRKAPAGK